MIFSFKKKFKKMTTKYPICSRFLIIIFYIVKMQFLSFCQHNTAKMVHCSLDFASAILSKCSNLENKVISSTIRLPVFQVKIKFGKNKKEKNPV